MKATSLRLLKLADSIEKHYLLKKNRRETACFSDSIEPVIKACETKVFKEELILLIAFLEQTKWEHAEEISKWFSSTKDDKLKSIGVIV